MKTAAKPDNSATFHLLLAAALVAHSRSPARACVPLWTAAVAGFFKSQGVALPF